jgi:molybdenum cofactor biosynthesis enzyme MoaA
VVTARADLDLLWALRSPCDLGCRYCYFGTVDEHRAAPVSQPGQLSHLSRADLTREEVFAFAGTLRGSRVRRVFLAGGEPLRWPPVLDLIRLIKQTGVQVVVCTNGIALNRPEITAALTNPGTGADAVSVSLDSADPSYNDRWRPSRNRKDGWRQVTSGITALLNARPVGGTPRIGIYSVITRLNIADILAVPRLAAELGCDFAVPQPIALDPGHPLIGQLSLTPATSRP